eukprot:5307322-Prymnesium_polylepis.1
MPATNCSRRGVLLRAACGLARGAGSRVPWYLAVCLVCCAEAAMHACRHIAVGCSGGRAHHGRT